MPATLSRRINIPVTPVTSLITVWSWRFISVNAFCIRGRQAAAPSTRVSRWRSKVRMAVISAVGRKLPRSKPKV